MQKTIGMGFALALLAAIPGRAAEPHVCVSTSLQKTEQSIGYELIDVVRRQAWITTDWTLHEYGEFKPGLTQLNWIKNVPRAGLGARMTVLRSPDCANDGEYTIQTKFGRSFFHIANIVSVGRRHGDNKELVEASVFKYHRLEFDADQTVSLLLSPGGDHFVLVNQPVALKEHRPELPHGWSITDVTLDGPWKADLFGHVRVLRTTDGASYQGPVEKPVADAQS